MSKVSCRAARPAVRWTALEGADPDSRLARHVAGCIHCQAESARARRTVRQVSSVFDSVEVPPAALIGGVMAATFETTSDDHPVRAASAAALAITAGAVFLIRRHQLSSR